MRGTGVAIRPPDHPSASRVEWVIRTRGASVAGVFPGDETEVPEFDDAYLQTVGDALTWTDG